MNRKRRVWIIIGAGVVITVLVGLIAFRLTLVCCAPQGDQFTATAIVALNQTTEAQIHQTQTAVFETAIAKVITATPSLYPYDATLYAQRRHEEQVLQTGAGPTQYAIFFATETGIVATYQGTVLPTATPIPYTADMSPTVTPTPRPIRTATPTLCPPSDVICPGGNATMSAADKVMVLMASAKAPEFGQLAQTATALAVTPTVTSNTAIPYVQCMWSWARQSLPNVSDAAQVAITEAGLKNVMVRSEAYGEDCNDSKTGKFAYFGAMTTDFYLKATVPDLNDADELARIVTTAYNTLTTLNVELPAHRGYLDITFTAYNQTKIFRAMFDEVKPIIEAGQDGTELLAVGGLQ